MHIHTHFTIIRDLGHRVTLNFECGVCHWQKVEHHCPVSRRSVAVDRNEPESMRYVRTQILSLGHKKVVNLSPST
jgi:hypothetical protein